MAEIHRVIVEHASAWIGADLADDAAWLQSLSDQHIAEIDAAIAAVRRRDLPMGQIGKADFPLPTLGPLLEAARLEIRDGRGFVVLRGFPVERYSDADAGIGFWGMGLYLGEPVGQNPQGDLLGRVYDQGRPYGTIDVRGYESKGHLPFHSDPADMVGLLCLRQAKSGGYSSIVSSVTLHNEVLRRRPDLLPPLYKGYRYIRREAALTEIPVTERPVPVFGARDGYVSCRLIPTQIEAACEKLAQPLPPLEREALDLVVGLCHDEELHLDLYLEPGDIQLCNNHTVLHSRTGFEDWPEPERRRMLLRLWLTFDQRRPLAEGFPAQDGYRRNDLFEVAMAPQAAG